MIDDRKSWPYPGDTAVLRARRIALAYREHLRNINPELCSVIDDTMRSYGQDWVSPEVYQFEPGQPLTTAQAAALVSVRVETIRQWACTRHPEDANRMLLPRYRRQGREMTYLIEHVEAAAAIMEHGKVHRSRARTLTTVS